MKRNVTCIVVNYNDFLTTRDFVSRVLACDSVASIIVVDNCSSDNSFQSLKEAFNDNENVRIIQSDRNGGYGYGNNYGIKYACNYNKPDFFIISNPDVIFDNSLVLRLCDTLDSNQESIAASGKMVQKDGKTGTLPWRIPTKKEYIFLGSSFFNRDRFWLKESDLCEKVMDVGCIPGSFLIVKNNSLIENGLFDEKIFLFCEETTIGIKFKKNGYKTIFDPNCSFIHLGSISIGKTYKTAISRFKLTLKSRYYVLKKYYGLNVFEKVFVKIAFLFQTIEKRIVFLFKGK